MSTSNYKRKNRKIVSNLADDLIVHMTMIERNDDNFKIAQRFAWARFDSHTFPDPNEHLIHKSWSNLELKLRLHSQEDRAKRLHYLYGEFLKRRTFEHGGLSDTHASVLLFLQAMSVNPTGRAEDAAPED
jgi:hypothetical protein